MKKLSMKKTTAAAATAAVGAALLLGGAGTLAYWSDDATSDGQNIASGELKLGALNGSTQTWEMDGSAYTSSRLIVPGDVLTTTVAVPVTLTGENNVAVLDVATPTLTGSTALADALEVEIVSVNNFDGNEAELTVESLAGASSVDVEISVTFDSATAELVAQAATVEFSAEYTLTQIAPVD